LLEIILSIEYFPLPKKNTTTDKRRNTNDNSLVSNGSAAWIKKNATNIVTPMGRIDRRVSRPTATISPHKSSAKITKPSEHCLPNPIGFGK
jgi:hypothetical protein